MQWRKKLVVLCLLICGFFGICFQTTVRAQGYEALVTSLGAEESLHAASIAAGPAAGVLDTTSSILDAPRKVIDPVFFFTRTLTRLPNLLRPAKAAWNIGVTPLRIFRPTHAIRQLADVPADLYAPLEFVVQTLEETPRLLGPIDAAGSILRSTARCFRSIERTRPEETSRLSKWIGNLF